jgi:hypothetical protein
MTVKLVHNLCSICKHRRRGLSCAAFPDRIPKDIRMMYADHRWSYPDDQGIQFELIDTEESRQKLQKVKVLKKPRPRPNELDRRVAAVVDLIRFLDVKHRRQFMLVVLNTDLFQQLPSAYQRLILDAEAQQVARCMKPGNQTRHNGQQAI